MQVPTLDNLGLNTEAVSAALRQLLRKGQIVLAGPPGTGKTKLAQELAAHLCDRDPARWRLIQLHPSYSYEDFISGLRPRGGGAAGFLVQPGHLLRILLEAQLQPGKDFCLVIDEFNRAKLATVLGELLTMLGGSRSTAAPVRIRDAPAFQEMTEMRWPIPGYDLPNEAAQWSSLASPIHMPPNLYLICTMNTADRSIAALDAALQRRFAMIQMVPSLLSPRAEVPNPEQPLLLPYSNSDSVLMQRCRLPSGERQALGAALDAINAKLDAMCFEPGERIGHSYFLSSDCRSRHDVRAAWREGVIPYLESVMQDRSQDLIRVIEREHSILADPILAGGAAAPEPRDEVLEQAEDLARALKVPWEMPSDVSNALAGWLSQLHDSKTHALLFAGPPGCGKTFTAEALAKVLVKKESERWETITFSPSYSYEEFMVGVRPDPSQPGKYKLQKGVLLEMAARCTPADGPRRRCVLVIDEFNRAKLPQVMGECLNMLEYRGCKVDLRDNTQESLPEELYVIAMMNNADRSIEPLDSALRRRFATVTFDVTKEPFRSIADGALQSRFGDLSNVAERMLTFLATAHAPGMLQVDEQIGVCFFCDAADELKKECTPVAEKRAKLVSVLKQVWAVEVGPYVQLHCVGERGRLDKVKVAWDAMVEGISGDASGDPAPAPTVTAQPSTQGVQDDVVPQSRKRARAQDPKNRKRARAQHPKNPVIPDVTTFLGGKTFKDVVLDALRSNPGRFHGSAKINDLALHPFMTEERAQQYPQLIAVRNRTVPGGEHKGKRYTINGTTYSDIRKKFQAALDLGKLPSGDFENLFVLGEKGNRKNPTRVAYFPQGVVDPMFTDAARGENGNSHAQLLAEAYPPQAHLFGIINNLVAE